MPNLRYQNEVQEGGTGRSSHTEYAVLCGGTTTTGAQQSIASVGTASQVLTSNGAGALPTFQDAAGGGGKLDLIESQTAANVANLDFTDLGTAGYNQLFVVMSGVQPITNGSYITMRVSNDNGSSFASTGYATGNNYHDYNSATLTNQNSTAEFVFADDIGSGQIFSGYFYMFDINIGRNVSIAGKSIYKDQGATLTVGDFGGQSGITGVNAVQFLMNSGNINTGVFTLFGVNEA